MKTREDSLKSTIQQKLGEAAEGPLSGAICACHGAGRPGAQPHWPTRARGLGSSFKVQLVERLGRESDTSLWGPLSPSTVA